MYPDQNQYSIDYLNQIAPTQQKPKFGGKWGVIVLILVVLLVAGIGIAALAKISAGPTDNLQRLAAQAITLQKISEDAQPNLDSGPMRSTNSSLTIFLSNMNRDIVDPLTKQGVKPGKLDKKIVAGESNQAMIDTLEDARLNATYDGVYEREMSFKLAELTALMGQLHSKAKSKSLKSFLVNADESLQPLRDQLTEAGAASTLK